MAQLMAHSNLAVWQSIPVYAWLYEVVAFILPTELVWHIWILHGRIPVHAWLCEVGVESPYA